MAEEKQTPEPEVKPEEPKDAPAAPLSDEDVIKLFANISEEAEKPPEAAPENAEKPEEGAADSPPATFDPAVLQTPEGQKAITEAVNQAIAAQSAGAETEAERKELQGLIDSGNNEELGKRWAKSMAESQQGKTAVDSFLTTFYRTLFSDPTFQNLTAEERKEIEPDGRFPNDAAYVKHLTKFMASKEKGTVSNEDLNLAVAARIEALKRAKAGERARAGSVQGAAPADGGTPSKSSDSRTLISEGLREAFPKAYAE